ncbi:hypothetical protein C8F01DRAFT_471345 [Mycena amicta]|nr:hypothetical protein C8F01DRAFT_471345 [Mycena amicta]
MHHSDRLHHSNRCSSPSPGSLLELPRRRYGLDRNDTRTTGLGRDLRFACSRVMGVGLPLAWRSSAHRFSPLSRCCPVLNSSHSRFLCPAGNLSIACRNYCSTWSYAAGTISQVLLAPASTHTSFSSTVMSPPTMDETYGAMYIGVLFATFLQGLLTVQVYAYYMSFPNDSLWLKTLVAAVWMLDTTHLVLIAQATYHYLVTSWGNYAALLVATTPFLIHMIFISVSSLLCQIFFLHRVWVFSKHNWLITGFLGCGCLAGFCVESTIIAELLRNPQVADFPKQITNVKLSFGVLAAFDLFLACTLVWYVRTTKTAIAEDVDHVSRRTNLILRRIMQYAVATGLTTSMVGLATLVAYLLATEKFIFIAIYFSFGRMYTNALLVSLNARRSLRSALQRPLSSTIGLSPWLGPPSLSVHQIQTSRNAQLSESNGDTVTEYPPSSLNTVRLRAESHKSDCENQVDLRQMAEVWPQSGV